MKEWMRAGICRNAPIINAILWDRAGSRFSDIRKNSLWDIPPEAVFLNI